VGALKKIAREKLTRIGLKIFRNLCRYDECVALMIDSNIIAFLAAEQKKPISDEKMKENIAFLLDVMERNYRIFSSYEKFLRELETERLAFGPCHTEKFWKEHFKKTEADDFRAVRALVRLLDSPDEATRAVACFDVGEFARLYPFSKLVLDKIDGKNKLMRMVEKESDAVREQALVALQKLMINNLHVVA